MPRIDLDAIPPTNATGYPAPYDVELAGRWYRRLAPTAGHRLSNRSAADCVFLAVSAGDRATDYGEYPDIDMVFGPDGYARKDGTPYPTRRLP